MTFPGSNRSVMIAAAIAIAGLVTAPHVADAAAKRAAARKPAVRTATKPAPAPAPEAVPSPEPTPAEPPPPPPPTAAELIEQAKQYTTQQRFVEALGAAQDANRLDPRDYRARYYVAMAYMGLRQFDQAEAEANATILMAPDASKPAVDKLITTIRTLRDGNAKLASADAALSEGLIGKAARLYEDAWEAGRNAPDHALKAARLYSERLDQPVDAARVLRQVKTGLPGTAGAEQAEKALADLQPTLRSIAVEHVKVARGLNWADAAARLEAAELADPTYGKIFTTRARLAAMSGSLPLTQDAIKGLARRNLLDIDDLAALPNMYTYVQDPGFSQFMVDVAGSGQAAQLRNSAAPAGRIAYLAQLAREGKLVLFLGRKRVDANSFRTYTRRKVTSVGYDANCQFSLALGDNVASSADAAAFLPPARAFDFRKMLIAPVLQRTYLEFGRTPDGWETAGLQMADGIDLADSVNEAVRINHAACPRPVKKGR